MGNRVLGHLDRRLLTALLLPPLDPVLLVTEALVFGFNLITGLALAGMQDGVHDELHAACFSSSVFLGTVLAEVSPLVVTALVLVLVEEAHIEWLFLSLLRVLAGYNTDGCSETGPDLQRETYWLSLLCDVIRYAGA